MQSTTRNIFGKLDSTNLLESAQFYLNSGIRTLYCSINNLDNIIMLKNRFPNIILMLDNPIKCATLARYIDLVRIDIQDYMLDSVQLMLKSHNITPVIQIHNQDEMNFALKCGIKSLCINDNDIANLTFNIINDDTTIMLDSNIDSINNAFVAFSRFHSILLGDFISHHTKRGKLLYKMRIIANKHSRFYQSLFNKKEIKILTGKLMIDDICNLSNIDALGFVLDSTDEINSKKHLLRFLSKFQPNLLKIGIINDKKIFNIARNFTDCGMLDAININYNQNDIQHLHNASFAFYSNDLDDKFLQSHLINRLKVITK